MREKQKVEDKFEEMDIEDDKFKEDQEKFRQ